MEHETILTVKDLSGGYRSRGLFGRRRETPIFSGVSFTLRRGETLGLVGESGSGKSTLARTVLGLQPPFSGEVIRGFSDRPQMIFQDPLGALNPAMTVEHITAEPLIAAGVRSRSERERAVKEIFDAVELPEACRGRRPGALSGGQRQRVCIAAALVTRPTLVAADEPVSALDVTLQAQILSLLGRLRKEMGLSMLFVSHDLPLVSSFCDRVLVMQNGAIVEQGDAAKVLSSPEHPFTKRLAAAALGEIPGRGKKV